MLCVLSHSVMSNSLQPRGLQPGRLFCPWGFSRQDYWTGLPCPPPGDLPHIEIKVRSPALRADPLPTEPWKYKTECHPATRRTEVLTWASLVAQSTHATLCMSLKNTTWVFEATHQRQCVIWLQLYEKPRVGKSNRAAKWSLIGNGVWLKMDIGFLYGVMKIF